MDTEVLKFLNSALPYMGGLGAVVILLAIMFRDSIKIFLEKDSTCKVTLRSHEKTLESHNQRLSEVEKNVAVLPAIQIELGHIRTTLDTILNHMIGPR